MNFTFLLLEFAEKVQSDSLLVLPAEWPSIYPPIHPSICPSTPASCSSLPLPLTLKAEIIQCVLRMKTCTFQLLRLAGPVRQIKSLPLLSLSLLRRIYFHPPFIPKITALFKEEVFVYLSLETDPFLELEPKFRKQGISTFY